MVQEIIDEQYKITAFTNPDCAIITPDSEIQVARWGLIPSWTKTEDEAAKIRKMTLNARSETVFSLPSFRNSIIKNRCLIPSTGFFEFHHEEKDTIPYYIYLKEEEIFSLGGVYEVWNNQYTNEIIHTFSVITVPANELCAKIHNGGKNPFRMPLIISHEREKEWLDMYLKLPEITDFLRPFNSDLMDAYPVTNDFLKKNSKDASIIHPAA